MEAKTAELLLMLLWAYDLAARPTMRNWSESFEAWTYRNGFHRQLCRLRQRGLVISSELPATRRRDTCDSRLLRLSDEGRLHALGGKNPPAAWSRSWDHKWRLVLFDVPESNRRLRDRLRSALRRSGYGYLQQSVWVTPDPVDQALTVSAGCNVDVESLVLMVANVGGGETNAQVVQGAWDFNAINRAYCQHGAVLAGRPSAQLTTTAVAERFLAWLRKEARAWQQAIDLDPLLPDPLLPPDYAGKAAWQNRLTTMAQAGEQMRGFRLPSKP